MKADIQDLPRQSGRAPAVSVAFVGDADAHFDPALVTAIKAAANGKDVVFDFSAVKRINSVGVRALLQLCKEIAASGALSYKRCVPEITEQFSLLPEFARYGAVVSLLVTEVCPQPHSQLSRSKPARRELVIGKDLIIRAGSIFIEPEHCSICGSELERSSHDDAVLNFLLPRK